MLNEVNHTDAPQICILNYYSWTASDHTVRKMWKLPPHSKHVLRGLTVIIPSSVLQCIPILLQINCEFQTPSTESPCWVCSSNLSENGATKAHLYPSGFFPLTVSPSCGKSSSLNLSPINLYLWCSTDMCRIPHAQKNSFPSLKL